MGVYLVPIDLDELAEDDGARHEIDAALTAAGLPILATVDGEGPGFEEKLSVDASSFEALIGEVLPTRQVEVGPRIIGHTRHLFPGSYADVWLPFAFSGLLSVPGVQGSYNAELHIASAVEVGALCREMATAIDFSIEVPALDPEGYVFNEWRDEMTPSTDPNDPLWRRDPDLTFHLALYRAVANYSIEHNEAVGYI